MSGLAEAARFSNSIDAGMARSRLEAEGLHCVLFDFNFNSGEGSFMYLPVRLMVLDEDLHEAREVLEVEKAVGSPPTTLRGWRWLMLAWFLFGPLLLFAILLWLE